MQKGNTEKKQQKNVSIPPLLIYIPNEFFFLFFWRVFGGCSCIFFILSPFILFVAFFSFFHLFLVFLHFIYFFCVVVVAEGFSKGCSGPSLRGGGYGGGEGRHGWGPLGTIALVKIEELW